jgi:RNA polymerase sigma-70 factor (ECF subfamily)
VTIISGSETTDSSLNMDDNKLIEKLKSGDPTAVVELYTAYADRIYSLVFNQVDGDRDAAQDIVQETFLAASKAARKFHGRSKVYTWLYSIAHNKIADFYRRKKREAKYQTISSDNQLDLSPGSEPLVTEITESEEQSQAIQEILSSLPLHYKQVLMLKYAEEMPVAEISQVMGRSPKSIEGLLTRARRELRNRLAAQNEGKSPVAATNITRKR